MCAVGDWDLAGSRSGCGAQSGVAVGRLVAAAASSAAALPVMLRSRYSVAGRAGRVLGAGAPWRGAAARDAAFLCAVRALGDLMNGRPLSIQRFSRSPWG